MVSQDVSLQTAAMLRIQTSPSSAHSQNFPDAYLAELGALLNWDESQSKYWLCIVYCIGPCNEILSVY